MGFFQYLKDTQGELRHVAWPTRFQTVVYTILVVLISVFIALYLGLFDFLFTSGLRTIINVLPARSPAAPQLTVTQVPTPTPATAPASPSPSTGADKKN